MNLRPSGWAVHPMYACEDKIDCLAAPNTEGVIAQRLRWNGRPGYDFTRNEAVPAHQGWLWALVATRGRSEPRVLGILGADIWKSRAVGPSA